MKIRLIFHVKHGNIVEVNYSSLKGINYFLSNIDYFLSNFVVNLPPKPFLLLGNLLKKHIVSFLSIHSYIATTIKEVKNFQNLKITTTTQLLERSSLKSLNLSLSLDRALFCSCVEIFLIITYWSKKNKKEV